MNKNIPSKENPKFGIITPTSYLRRFATQSPFHLALAHLVISDKQYADFYTEMSERGDFVIMDNSAYELGASFEPSKLLELGKRIKADAIVLPDYPGQAADKTINAAKELAPQIKDSGFKTFFVPQSALGNLSDWLDGYTWGSENEEIDIIGMSILGIPNALPQIDRIFARVVMSQVLIGRGDFNFNKYHHFLGLNSPNEIASLLSLGVVDSLDSSNPVWCGINNWKYSTTSDSFMPKSKKYLPHVDFAYKRPGIEYQENIIDSNVQHNLDIVLDIFKQPAKYI